MKKRFYPALALVLGFSLFAAPGLAKKKKAEAVGADYKSYTVINSTPHKSESHEKRLVTIYVNKTGADAYRKLSAPLPEGTIIAKETFEDKNGKPGKLVEISVMKKLKAGQSKDSGDWYFAVLNPDGTLKEENGKTCIECHSFSANDYVFGVGK